MDNSIGIVVGIDIAHDYTQVSYYTAGMNEPESMSTIYNEQKYRLEGDFVWVSGVKFLNQIILEILKS